MSRPKPSADQLSRDPYLPAESYTVGWICALPCELAAARAMVDQRHGGLKSQSKHDANNYTLGSIAGHNIAIACLPEYGTNKAAIAAKSMQATFPNIRFGLLVGVGGGVPGSLTTPDSVNDIHLGDVVVSLPAGQGGGVIQYDLGRREVGGFRRVGVLNKPPALLRTAVASLRAERSLGRQLTGLIEEAFALDDEDREGKSDDEEEESEAERWAYPGTGKDVLFRSGYQHRPSAAEGCTKCIETKGPDDVVTRRGRRTTHPKIHYGNIGSGNSLIKNGLERDELAQLDNIVCFEMEAAGLMDDFPCLVIRGVSDYADSHKNSSWQPYAAASAAAFAKQLVRIIAPQDIDSLAPIQGSFDSKAEHSGLKTDQWSVLSVDLDLPFARNPRFTGRQDVLSQIQEYFSGEATSLRTLLLYGIGGIGKSQVASHYVHSTARHTLATFWVDARDRSSVELNLACIAQSVLGSLVTHYDEQTAATMFGFSDVTSLLSQEPIPPKLIRDASRALKRWLGRKSNSGWLILFDNYDNIDEFDIEEYFPSGDHGRILITSRRPDLQRIVGKSIEISVLDDGSALQLLLSNNPMYKADDTPTSPSVQAVLTKLCNLPLAVVQANAYINNRRLSMDDFLQQYEQQFNRPMGNKPRGPWNYGQVVNTTWEVSLSAIQTENELATETIFTCSLLGDTNILPEMTQSCIPGIRDSHQMHDCFEILASYCLINQQWKDGRFWIHPVVHKWAWTVQSQDNRSRRSINVLRAFMNIEKSGQRSGSYVRDVLPHLHTFVLCSLPDIETQHLDSNDAKRLHSLLSVFPHESGKSTGIVCLKGLDLSRYLEMPAPLFFTFYLELATCLAKAGWSKLSRVLSARSRLLLFQSQDSILRVGHLYHTALYAFNEGRLGEAEKTCRELLPMLERMETKEDLRNSFLRVQMLLAQIMAKQKDGSKSDDGYQMAYEIVHQIVSSKLYRELPESLDQVAEYGKMLLSRGDIEGARTYYSNGIQLMMDSQGPTAMTLSRLDEYCHLLLRLKYYSEVEPYLRWMLEKSLDMTKKRIILRKISFSLERQKKFGELELIARRMLELERENISKGEDSGYIIFPTVYLCTALFETGRNAEAAIVADESLSLHQKNIGPGDSNTSFLRDLLRELRNGRLLKFRFTPT